MDDLISRQQVLSYIDRIMTQGTGKNKSFDFMRKYVENMPSAQPDVPDTNVGDMTSRQEGGRVMSASDEIIYPKRWIDIFHYGFGYTKCPYCGDETGWYNPASDRYQSDLKNNQREHCPKCGKRVFAREGWLMNQPSFKEGE